MAKPLYALIVAFTLAMMAVHLNTGRLIKQWTGRRGSWLPEWFTVTNLVRGEALYWALVLLSRPWKIAPPMKFVVAIFATLHLAVWLLAEFRRMRGSSRLGAVTGSPRAVHAIAAFDFVEAIALLAVGWCAAVLLLRS